MPFALRAVDAEQKRFGLVECINHGLLHPYPVLHEKTGELVGCCCTVHWPVLKHACPRMQRPPWGLHAARAARGFEPCVPAGAATGDVDISLVAGTCAVRDGPQSRLGAAAHACVCLPRLVTRPTARGALCAPHGCSLMREPAEGTRPHAVPWWLPCNSSGFSFAQSDKPPRHLSRQQRDRAFTRRACGTPGSVVCQLLLSAATP
jgi:hypothetical protein